MAQSKMTDVLLNGLGERPGRADAPRTGGHPAKLQASEISGLKSPITGQAGHWRLPVARSDMGKMNVQPEANVENQDGA